MSYKIHDICHAVPLTIRDIISGMDTTNLSIEEMRNIAYGVSLDGNAERMSMMVGKETMDSDYDVVLFYLSALVIGGDKNAAKGLRWLRKISGRDIPSIFNPRKKTDRNAEMVRLRYDEQMTLQEIADLYGVSRERVRQITGNAGRDVIDDRLEKRRRYIRSSRNKTNEELAVELELSKSAISACRAGTRYAVNGGTLELGTNGENKVSKRMTALGIDHKLMPYQHAFDILVGGRIKIDVKTTYSNSHPPSLEDRIVSPMWKFSTKKRDADFYIFLIDETNDMFVVPVGALNNSKQTVFCWPTLRPEISKMAKYHEAWDLLIKAIDNAA